MYRARRAEIAFPAWLAVWLGLVGYAGEAPAVHQHQVVFRLALGKAYVMHVHLLDFEITVGIHAQRRHAGREHHVLLRQAGERDRAPADMRAADVAHVDRVGRCAAGDAGRENN
jgi:hypothetical protein